MHGRTPYFLIQTKATTSALTTRSTSLTISSRREDVARLLKIPGPTYILGVHEPTRRVFAKSVHTGVAVSAKASTSFQFVSPRRQ